MADKSCSGGHCHVEGLEGDCGETVGGGDEGQVVDYYVGED